MPAGIWGGADSNWGTAFWGFDPGTVTPTTTLTGAERWRIFARFEVDLTDDIAYNFLPRLPAGKKTLEWANLRTDSVQGPETPDFIRLDEDKLDTNRIAAVYGEGFSDWTDITSEVRTWSFTNGNINKYRPPTGSLRLYESATKWVPGITGSHDIDGRMYIAFAAEKDDKLVYFNTMIGNVEEGGNISLFGFYQHLENAQCNPFVRLAYTWTQMARMAMGATLEVEFDTQYVIPFKPGVDDPETFNYDPGIPYINKVVGGRPPHYLGLDVGYEYDAPNLNATLLNGIEAISQLQAGHACEGPNGQIMHQSVWELGSNSSETATVDAGESGVIINELEPVYRRRYTIFTYLPPDSGIAIQDEYRFTDEARLRKWGAKRVSLPSWLGNDPLDGLERYAFYTDPGYYRMWQIEMQKAPVDVISAFMRYPIVVKGNMDWADNQTYAMTPVEMTVSSNGVLIACSMKCAENIEGELFVLDESMQDVALIG